MINLPAVEKPKECWKNADGIDLPVAELSDSHLLNIKKMCERKGIVSSRTVAFYLYGPQPSGDGAMMAYEKEVDAVLSAPCSIQLTYVEKEIERRGLK